MISRIRLYQKLKPIVFKFHALDNISRVSIVYTLAREAMEFGQISRRLKISPSLLSHHLKQLTNAGWVTKMKVGNLVTYYISEDLAKKLSVFMRKFLSPQSESN